MIEVTSTTPLNTVQDLGRHTSRRYGVGTSGAMDDLSVLAANALLNNEPTAACIEIQVFPFSVTFLAECDFVVTGGEGETRLDDQTLPTWWVMRAQKGQVLTIQRPAVGCRCYLALGGGLDLPEVLNSRSTQLRGQFGGVNGRALLQDDHILAKRPVDLACTDFGMKSHFEALALFSADGEVPVRVIPASEYRAYSDDSQARFWQTSWKISSQSNRYGYRLTGGSIKPETPLEMLSHGIVPGVIQMPPNGEPIIQLRDAQPTGGYPKIGTVIDEDIWRLGQAAIGKTIRFVECSINDIESVRAESQGYLDRLVRNKTLMEGL
jgi:biotin-dependent carboxylase-like uncharacterized protein